MATIFTKIINGDIPAHKVAENDDHIAFMDINPSAEGHTLVVPKKEVDYFFDLDDELLGETMKFAKKVAHAIDKAVSPLRTGIIVEGLEGPPAHVHLIPIYETTQPFSLSHNVEVSDERMKELAAEISNHFEA